VVSFPSLSHFLLPYHCFLDQIRSDQISRSVVSDFLRPLSHPSQLPADTEAKEETEEMPHSLTQYSCEQPSTVTAASVCHMPAWEPLQAEARVCYSQAVPTLASYKSSVPKLVPFCNLPPLALPLPFMPDSASGVLLYRLSTSLPLSSSSSFFSPSSSLLPFAQYHHL